MLEGYQWHHLDDNYPAEMNANISNHAMVVTEQVLFFIGGEYQAKQVRIPKTLTRD